MNIKQKLELAAAKYGATVEEDPGYRNMRVFQLVAPQGKIWEEGVLHIRVELQRGNSPVAQTFNAQEITHAIENMSNGARPMTDIEKELCADD